MSPTSAAASAAFTTLVPGSSRNRAARANTSASPHLRADQEARVAPGNVGKQRSQVLDWQFTDWKDLLV
jgi:hypothetical protein